MLSWDAVLGTAYLAEEPLEAGRDTAADDPVAILSWEEVMGAPKAEELHAGEFPTDEPSAAETRCERRQRERRERRNR